MIDLVAFELIPGFLFGGVGFLILMCNCKCCLFGMIGLDLYRAFRNIAA